MTIQRSNCCKATIDLDKTKERPECYTCSKCGRIIGSPLPQPTMNQIPNIEETHNTREWESEFIKLVTGTTPDKATVPPQWIDFVHQQLQKAREEERERIKTLILDTQVPSSEGSANITHHLLLAISERDQDKK